MEPLLDKKNSVIFRNPQEYFADISGIFTRRVPLVKEPFEQKNHCFLIGDALYYDASDKKFQAAIARNTKQIEVVGVVAQIIDNDHFELSTTGLVETIRYPFPTGTQLYLSDVNAGKLVSIPPATSVKPVAVCGENGIIIEIDTGWFLSDDPPDESEYEPYTQEELDEIILNIW